MNRTSIPGSNDELAPFSKQTLVEAALEVLNEPDPLAKARLGESTATRWLHGAISLPYSDHDPLPTVPDRPARLPTVKLVPSRQMPRLGKCGTLETRQATLHSLVHIESCAIDLSWDIIARFGRQQEMPREFFDDFVKVARDEGRHFAMLNARLEEMGSFYGAFVAHDGLWDSAMETAKDLLGRLAVEHCVHEARGLDVLPTTISRFRSAGDECTAKLLETIVYPEEITHCAAGLKWFKYLCHRTLGHCRNATPTCGGLISQNPAVGGLITLQHLCRGDADSAECLEAATTTDCDEHEVVIPTFHATVRRYFRGSLKPPFNVEARKAAGFTSEWYEPLVVRESVVPN